MGNRSARQSKGWARPGRIGIIAGMSDGTFTAKAAVLWGTIPKEARTRILANVFCVKCRGSVTIKDFTGEEENGDVILKGACAKCGHEVVRVVETSEHDNSGN
jgi:hypothetical protein